MVKFLSTQTVLSIAVFSFSLITAILLIVDRATGGKIKGRNDPEPIYGDYPIDTLFPIFVLSGFVRLDVPLISGLFHGMVELVRRVIRRDLVGGHMSKMQKLDAFVKPLDSDL